MPFDEYILTAEGMNVIQTKHAYERALRKGMDPDNCRTFIEEIAYHINRHRDRLIDFGINEEIFYYSLYFKRGAIVAIRPDFKQKDKLVIVLITIYPEGSRAPMHPDTRIERIAA
jgi:hypothetical protein